MRLCFPAFKSSFSPHQITPSQRGFRERWWHETLSLTWQRRKTRREREKGTFSNSRKETKLRRGQNRKKVRGKWWKEKVETERKDPFPATEHFTHSCGHMWSCTVGWVDQILTIQFLDMITQWFGLRFAIYLRLQVHDDKIYTVITIDLHIWSANLRVLVFLTIT